MKILRVCYEWPPPWEGLVPHPFELTRAQLKLGHTFYVYSGRWPFSGTPEEPEGVKLLHFMGNSTLPFREPIRGTLLVTIAPLLLLRYIFWRLHNKDIELIHCHGHFAFWIYQYRSLLAKFSRKSPELKIPLVVHFHNTVEGRWRKMDENNKDITPISKYLDWPLARSSDKLAVKIADALVFVSEDVKNEAIEFYDADPSKCFVLESGVNPDLFKPMGAVERDNVHNDLGIDPQDRLILNLGMLVERKNIHLIIEALQHLPDKYKLLLVGPRPDSIYNKKLDELIKTLKLEERILFGGSQPYPEVPILYQGANIFVLPSSFEGMPKVVLESIACGVPVLGSAFKLSQDIPGIYYLDNLEPANIAKRIFEISEQQVFVDRTKLVDLYSWDTRAQALEKIYKFAFENRAKALEKVLG